MNTGSINRPDARIALASQVPDLGQTFSNVLMNVQRMDAIREGRAQEGLRNRLLEAQAQQQEAAAPTQQELIIKGLEQQALFGGAVADRVLPFLKADDFEGAKAEVESIRRQMIDAGQSTKLIDGVYQGMTDHASSLASFAQMSDAANQIRNRGQQQALFQKGATFTTRTDQGEAVVTSVFDPRTGKTRLEVTPLGQDQKFVSRLGETPKEQTGRKIGEAKSIAKARADVELETVGPISGTRKASEQAIKKSGEAFDKLEKIQAGISNYDEAIKLIDEGAETGPIMSMLPSFKSASVQLDNLQGRLGLDVVGNTTFGALSEAELNFALDTALPKKLQGQDLRKWLVSKREAQKKLSRYIEEYAQFVGTPGNKLSDWIQLQKANSVSRQETGPANKVIRFDAQGNIIQ